MKRNVFIILSLATIIFFSSFMKVPNFTSNKKQQESITPTSIESKSSGQEPIKWSGKIIGYLNWSIEKYQQTNSGGYFLTVSVYNDSSEDIRFCITGKNAYSCSDCGFRLRSQQRKEIVFSCSDRVSDFTFNIIVD